MPYKFERLEVWQMALDYSDMMYALINKLPYTENDNLRPDSPRNDKHWLEHRGRFDEYERR